MWTRVRVQSVPTAEKYKCKTKTPTYTLYKAYNYKENKEISYFLLSSRFTLCTAHAYIKIPLFFYNLQQYRARDLYVVERWNLRFYVFKAHNLLLLVFWERIEKNKKENRISKADFSNSIYLCAVQFSLKIRTKTYPSNIVDLPAECLLHRVYKILLLHGGN